jgi:hypothetical protein
MSVLPIGALSAPDTNPANASSSITQPHRKHGVQSLTGNFALAASNALGAIGSARVAVSNTVQAALGNLKASG